MRILGLITLFFVLQACSKNEDSETPQPPEVQEIAITSFSFNDLDPSVSGTIDQEALTIEVIVPAGTDLKSLKPTIQATQGATVSPAQGFVYDFSNGMNFKVTAGELSKTYSVSVTNALNASKEIESFSVPSYFLEGTVDGDQISISFRYGSDLTQVVPELVISDGATISPENGATIDLTQPVTYTVTAENGETKEFTVTATVQPQETAVRAFWIPATWHSPFLRSYEDIQEGVAMADELNFNTLYVCAWSQTRTLYPSQTLADNSSYTTPEEALFNNYTGGTGDALRDLITEAHKKDIKVILWYEYGFMSRFGTAPTPENDRILAVHPDWIGINNQGTQSAYNNNDYYYNAYNPEVQEFMLDMIMEAVTQYDIDGIQGDDRLPAMPRNSGYDDYTRDRYLNEKGINPPTDFNDGEWVRFRADILNNFAKEMYARAKAAKPNLIIGYSPNPYPWAFENLMQEWPVWLNDNVVEVLSVQCYRNTVSQYEATINEVLSYYTTNGSGNLETLSPGIILRGSNGLADPEVVAGQILKNREKGIPGESFFYDVPLTVDVIRDVIKGMYPGKAKFPETQQP